MQFLEGAYHVALSVVLLLGTVCQVVYESKAVVEMREPYIPGFLAFREVEFLLERLGEIHRQQPQHYPQVYTDGQMFISSALFR